MERHLKLSREWVDRNRGEPGLMSLSDAVRYDGVAANPEHYVIQIVIRVRSLEPGTWRCPRVKI